MSVVAAKKICDLELALLKRGDEITAEEARQFYDSLMSCYEQYLEFDNQTLDPDIDATIEHKYYKLSISDEIQKKVIRLQKSLKKFLPILSEPTSSQESEVNHKSIQTEPSVTAFDLNSRLQKQKFLIKLIECLEPSKKISPKEAEIRYSHLTPLYESFVSNQIEISTLASGDECFDDQVTISEEVQQKVIFIQTSLKGIISPTKKTPPVESKKSGNPHVIVDFLDSLVKKQKSLIEQIESLESKSELDETEAEILFDHLAQLHESFVRNQTKIEDYVNGPTLDTELRISRDVLQKVVSLQIKFKKIFNDVSSLDSNHFEDELCGQNRSFDLTTYMNSLLEKQRYLMKQMQGLLDLDGSYSFV